MGKHEGYQKKTRNCTTFLGNPEQVVAKTPSPAMDADSLRESIISRLEAADGIGRVRIHSTSDHVMDGTAIFDDGKIAPFLVKYKSKREYFPAKSDWNPSYIIDSNGRVYLDGRQVGWFKLNVRQPEIQKHVREPESVYVYATLDESQHWDPVNVAPVVSMLRNHAK